MSDHLCDMGLTYDYFTEAWPDGLYWRTIRGKSYSASNGEMRAALDWYGITRAHTIYELEDAIVYWFTHPGSRSHYVNHGCRAPQCRKADTAYKKERAARWKAGR